MGAQVQVHKVLCTISTAKYGRDATRTITDSMAGLKLKHCMPSAQGAPTVELPGGNIRYSRLLSVAGNYLVAIERVKEW